MAERAPVEQLYRLQNEPGLDADYAERRIQQQMQELLAEEQAGMAQSPEVQKSPTRPLSEQEQAQLGEGQPSAVVEGAKATGTALASGVQNVAGGIFGDDVGQALYGGMELASALPAGVGAAVQQAFKNYAPGMESAEVPIAPEWRGYLRTVLATPGLLLDPEQRAQQTEQPTEVAAGLDAPMTYGELANIVTQLASPFLAKGAKAAGAKVGEIHTGPEGQRGAIGRTPQKPLVGPDLDFAHIAISDAQMAALQKNLGLMRFVRDAQRGGLDDVTIKAEALKRGFSPDEAAAAVAASHDVIFDTATGEVAGLHSVQERQRAVAPERAFSARPTAEARVNVARHEAPESAKAVMTAISQLVGEGERIKQSRATVPHAQTISEGAKWPLGKLLATDPERVTLKDARGYQQGLRDNFNAAAQHVDALAEQIMAGSEAAKAQWYSAQVVLARLAELQEMVGTEGGRLLEARKILGDRTRASEMTPEALAAFADRMAAGMSPEDGAAQWASTPKPERKRVLTRVWDGLKNGKDIAYESWMQGLLSWGGTDLANIFGSAGSIMVDLGETMMAELVNRMRRDPLGTRPGEAWAKAGAIGEGFVNGVRLAGKALHEGAGADAVQAQLLSFTNKAGEQRGFYRASNFGMDPESTAAAAINAIIPTLRQGAEDAVFKGTAYTMSIAAQARRRALMEGKTSPEAIARRVEELQRKPDGAMITEAVEDAKRLTLNLPPGESGQAINTFVENTPGMRWILPFRNFAMNSGRWMGQRAPVLGMLAETNRADWNAGGVRRDRMIARQLTGTAVAGAVTTLVLQGRITGSGDPNRTLKRLEKEERPPYSMLVGDTWVSYDRYDPVGGLVGAIADFMELTQRIPHQDAMDEWAAYGEALVLAAGHTMVNKTYMKGLADALDAIKEPDRYGASWTKKFAGSIVPAAVRNTRRALDDQVIRDARGIVDQVKSGIPGYAEDVSPIRNQVTGEAFRYPTGGPSNWLPAFTYTTRKNDPVIVELLKNRVDLAPLPWVIGGSGSAKTAKEGPQMEEPMQTPPVLLTPKQRDFWIVQMTNPDGSGVVDGNGDNLHGALLRAMRSDLYQRLSPGPDGSRADYLRGIYSAFKQMAFARLIDPETGSPTLKGKIMERATKAAERKLPVDDPRSPYRGGASPSRLPGSLTR